MRIAADVRAAGDSVDTNNANRQGGRRTNGPAIANSTKDFHQLIAVSEICKRDRFELPFPVRVRIGSAGPNLAGPIERQRQPETAPADIAQ